MLQIGTSFSYLAFSCVAVWSFNLMSCILTDVILMVRHFQVLHFQSTRVPNILNGTMFGDLDWLTSLRVVRFGSISWGFCFPNAIDIKTKIQRNALHTLTHKGEFVKKFCKVIKLDQGIILSGWPRPCHGQKILRCECWRAICLRQLTLLLNNWTMRNFWLIYAD